MASGGEAEGGIGGAVPKEDTERREIGSLAVWSVTSAKPGNGVELLRDGNIDTYWQSDGAQPHLVNIQFQKKVRLQELALYADFKHDESYTPARISIRAGNSFHDMREIKVLELEEPVGWVSIPLCPPGYPRDFLRAYLIQMAVLSNHQNGRDTHIRQIKIFGPRQNTGRAVGHPLQFNTTEMSIYATVR